MINFKLFNINFCVSVSFFCIFTLMLMLDKSGILFITSISILIHEAGHLIAMLIIHSPPEKICLKAGSVGIVAKGFCSFFENAFVCIAGPFCNLIFFAVFYFAFLTSSNTVMFNFAAVNIVLFVFHMLPVSGLDGGTVLICAIIRKAGEVTALKILKIVSINFAILFVLGGAYLIFIKKSNPSLLLLGIYLIFQILLKQMIEKQ